MTHIGRWPTAAVRDRLSWSATLCVFSLFCYIECSNVVRQGKAFKNINKFCICFFNWRELESLRILILTRVFLVQSGSLIIVELWLDFKPNELNIHGDYGFLFQFITIYQTHYLICNSNCRVLLISCGVLLTFEK